MVHLKDIAADVGMDVGTVSRVLNGKDRESRISAKRAAVIRAAAARLGYRPNLAARAVSTGRFGCLALLLATDRTYSDLPGRVLDGMQSAMARNDLHLTVAALPDEQLTSEGHIPKILRTWMADGLIVNYSHHIPARMMGLIRAFQIPSVWLNSRQEADCVHFDDFSGGERLTRHLLELGQRRIAYVDLCAGQDDLATAHHSVRDRCAGYEQAMRAAGLAPVVHRPPRHIAGVDRVGWFRQELAAPDRPTALVTYGPGDATPAYIAARELGLRVPGDLSLGTFEGDGPATMVLGTVFTACRLPHGRMGAAIVDMAVRKLAQPRQALPPEALVPTLEAGWTAAGPAA